MMIQILINSSTGNFCGVVRSDAATGSFSESGGENVGAIQSTKELYLRTNYDETYVSKDLTIGKKS
jgi:hypothetical protein